MAKKRLYRTIFGIPLWIITGISLFIIFSALYDWFVGDRNTMRYIVLGGSVVILIMSIILHVTPASSIGQMAGRQLGR